MKTTLIHPATFKLDGGAMFGIIPKPLWEKKIIPDQYNRINMSLRLVLFETKTRKILVDTGIGDYHSEKFIQQFDIRSINSPITTALSELEIKAEQITDIVLTHLHFDHIGGLGTGRDGQELIFPNATIHLHKNHFEYAQNPTLRDSGSFHLHTFKPILDQYKKLNQINYLTGEEGTILNDNGESLNFKTSFGHTPYMIHPYNDNFIYMADLVPMRHHVHTPWVMGYDIEPGVTTVYKEKFYDFIIKKNLTVIFEHDDEVWGATLSKNEKGRTELAKEFKSDHNIVQRI